MSYEGYVQCICKNGHYYEYNAYARDNDRVCYQCGTESAWTNAVSETNCDSYGQIPMKWLREQFLKEKAHVETCNLGHQHTVKQETFYIPTPSHAERLRCVRIMDGSTPLISLYAWEVKAKEYAASKGRATPVAGDWYAVKAQLIPVEE